LDLANPGWLGADRGRTSRWSLDGLGGVVNEAPTVD
jgi:hypothetical protein